MINSTIIFLSGIVVFKNVFTNDTIIIYILHLQYTSTIKQTLYAIFVVIYIAKIKALFLLVCTTKTFT